MSGDVQPRKRKDKRKKKDEEELVQHHASNGGSDEVIHVYKESKLGGNICSKIVFFGLLGALGVMVALIIFEYHGTNDIETQSAADSPWSKMLDGWVDEPGTGHDDHDEEHLGHGEEEHEDHDNHEDLDEHEAHNHNDSEYSESEHEDEEEVENESFVQETYEQLKSAYSQITPEDSDAEPTKDTDSKAEDYSAIESEPEPSETEEEEEEGEIQEDDPLGQWKSESGPELLAEEVKEVQTESETEEESDDEIPSTDARGGPQSNENQEILEDQEFSSEEPAHSSQNNEKSENKEPVYKTDDVANQADWEIKEELDEAEQDLDEGNLSSALSKFSTLVSKSPLSVRAIYGKARALDALAESRHSNSLLQQAISAYTTALQVPDIPDALLCRLANRTIDRLRFKGLHLQAVDVHNKLIERFPTNITYQIELAITFLMINSCVAD